MSKSINKIPNCGDEHRGQRLAPEAEGLDPIVVGGHFIIGYEADINGSDAVIMDFEPTRGELKMLADHYLSRFFTIQGIFAMGQSGSFEIRESAYTWRRFQSIAETLSPGQPIKEYEEYIAKEWIEIKKIEKIEAMVAARKDEGMATENKCPDCGVDVGESHTSECDIVRCSVCGEQRITCNCERHDHIASAWTGEWPQINSLAVQQSNGEPSDTTRSSDGEQELSPDEEDFLRKFEEYLLDDSQPVDHSTEVIGMEEMRNLTVKQRLLRYVAVNINEVATHTASDALSDMLYDAHEEMAVDLLEPLFERSDFWTQRIAAELLGLPTDVEYDCEELVREFEHRDRIDERMKDERVDWLREGL